MSHGGSKLVGKNSFLLSTLSISSLEEFFLHLSYDCACKSETLINLINDKRK